jgi:hypothetical protein
MKIAVDLYEGHRPWKFEENRMKNGQVIEVQSFVLWPGGRPVYHLLSKKLRWNHLKYIPPTLGVIGVAAPYSERVVV